jgi:UDP-N-acetylmuramoyl-tripeptide--D-alanyl-D-alanine ligase
VRSLKLKDVFESIGGELVKGDDSLVVKRIVKVPRKIKSKTLYFDMHRNEKEDLEYFSKYSSIVVVTNKPDDFKDIKGCAAIIKVKSASRAFWCFIDYYRGLFDIPIIGISGTCGKTTTKEMIKHILSKKYSICATRRNLNFVRFNCETLLRFNDKTQFGVFEIGLKKPGDVAKACKYFRPQIRVLLNIGVYHLAGCKTPEGYIKAKSELFQGLDPENGVLILNADDENIRKLDVSKYKKIIYFGFSEKSHFKAQDVKNNKNGISFILSNKGKSYKVHIPGCAKHNIYNALASIAAVSAAGIQIKEACKTLGSFKSFEKHLQFRQGVGGCTIIDDSWNNNPTSMESALQVLKETSIRRRKVAIVSQMPSIGESKYAAEQYVRMGKKVVETGLDFLLVIGEEAKAIGTTAIKLGMDKSKVYFSKDGSDITKVLSPLLNYNSSILIKMVYRKGYADAVKRELYSKIFV